MNSPVSYKSTASPSSPSELPSSLQTACYAVALLEDNPLFNSGKGAVFTRDGINELEASVMVSRGYKKRGVGVTGLRHVKNPITLAKSMLVRGEEDLGGANRAHEGPMANRIPEGARAQVDLDVPTAQGHTLIHGAAAEALALKYGCELVEQGYFFTKRRWDEHIRALEREKGGEGTATWSPSDYLPQGTCGAVALDEDGVVCCATSTGGMTNKLTGRIGDTPVVGAGFWAEDWEEDGNLTGRTRWESIQDGIMRPGAAISVTNSLRGLLADCLPTPRLYTPPPTYSTTTRSMAVSGTGNGDSFLRLAASRTVGSVARWKPAPTSKALYTVAGPLGELQKSAGDRWGRTGEGEGGMIGIECAVVRDASERVVETRGEILQAFNCGGMYRAWVDEEGRGVMCVWHEDEVLGWMESYEGVPVELATWEKAPVFPE